MVTALNPVIDINTSSACYSDAGSWFYLNLTACLRSETLLCMCSVCGVTAGKQQGAENLNIKKEEERFPVFSQKSAALMDFRLFLLV